MLCGAPDKPTGSKTFERHSQIHYENLKTLLRVNSNGSLYEENKIQVRLIEILLIQEKIQSSFLL